jgi:hypothetical protein
MKLSLDALKERAELVQTEEMMNQIEGGGLFDCHGFWGAFGKKVRDIVVDKTIEKIEEAIEQL